MLNKLNGTYWAEIKNNRLIRFYFTRHLGWCISILSCALTLVNIAHAEEVSIFERYGIPEHLPKFGISTLSQGDHIVEHVRKVTSINDESSSSSFYLVQTTDLKGNIDLRIKYFPDQISQLDGEPSLAEDGGAIDSIEYLTKTEYRLRTYAESYDRSSVTVEELDERRAIVRFNYSKYQLPQDVAYFRFMRVEIHVEDRKPVKMVLTNSQPFTYGTYRIKDYRQETVLSELDNGSLYVKNKTIVANGETRKKEKLTLSVVMTPVAFYDDVDGAEVLDSQKLEEASDPRIREEKVEVDSFFPLMGDLVRRQGIDIPLPYGFSVAYRNQDMDIDFRSFTLGLGALGLQNLDKDFDPSQTFGYVNAESLTVRGDVYILPFWNVYGLAGKIKVRANIDAKYTSESVNEIKDKLNGIGPGLGDALCDALTGQGLPLCRPGRLNIPLSLDYDLLGVGTTLAVGYKEFFATLNMTVSQTRLEGSSSWGDTLFVAQPMVGYQFVDYRAQILVGAEYQGIDSTLSGSLGYVDALQGEFSYDVDVSLNQWAYLIGVNKQLGKHFNITALYNKGETRDAYTLSFGYRW
ncbi:hypothetical protein [Vibrio aestuarianus]|uniref:hypothetical protein n=1 Tax=Vibrio aestuarianus TaxID=28171 RepID=UPI001FE3EE13|nr:hypothetical protein [Vibrio aestuarianus]MDE1214973.1 hypothetical protein [Vibrio aestuarianus]MDE1219040.1 hypothetical protein [Vibrio aestuarianus]MDE1262052.1 hypothetical protein [Vibrio aestuarianus]MDE1269109.1 hypothetical protein [Vibrio aestuarianus]MDE1276351.1 hypothetical protein [Vibrio aestuarianus]